MKVEYWTLLNKTFVIISFTVYCLKPKLTFKTFRDHINENKPNSYLPVVRIFVHLLFVPKYTSIKHIEVMMMVLREGRNAFSDT